VFLQRIISPYLGTASTRHRARLRILTEKLAGRLRPFVEVNDPGAPRVPETAAVLRECCAAENLKLQSFVIELHAIGTLYLTKASGFLTLFLVWALSATTHFPETG
jgi:hypothetical protein